MVQLSYRFAALMNLIFQNRGAAVEMADQLRGNGKIYVVVTILLIILMGILIYLISLDKKISKIEKQQKKQ